MLIYQHKNIEEFLWFQTSVTTFLIFIPQIKNQVCQNLGLNK